MKTYTIRRHGATARRRKFDALVLRGLIAWTAVLVMRVAWWGWVQGFKVEGQ